MNAYVDVDVNERASLEFLELRLDAGGSIILEVVGEGCQ